MSKSELRGLRDSCADGYSTVDLPARRDMTKFYATASMLKEHVFLAQLVALRAYRT